MVPMAGILIIDDDPTIRTMFARALQSHAEIEQASNGAEGLRLLEAKKYGVVLLDLHMPGVDGLAVLQALSTKPGPNRDTPIIVVTADTSDKARAQAFERRAVFVLTKPVPLATLGTVVASALKRAARTNPPSSGPLSPRPDSSGRIPPSGSAGREPDRRDDSSLRLGPPSTRKGGY